jgi:hypothetical protein
MRVLIGMQNISAESDERCGTPRENVGKNEPATTSIVMLPSLSGRLGRLPVRSDDHLQPRRDILALALLAQQIALAEVPMMRTDASAAVWIVLARNC